MIIGLSLLFHLYSTPIVTLPSDDSLRRTTILRPIKNRLTREKNILQIERARNVHWEQ